MLFIHAIGVSIKSRTTVVLNQTKKPESLNYMKGEIIFIHGLILRFKFLFNTVMYS